MGFKRSNVSDGNLGLPDKGRAGDGWLAHPAVTNIQAADSNQVLGISPILGGLYIRNGMTAARTDTTDTAVNLLAGLDGMDVGETHVFGVSVTTAFAWNIAAGTGVTLLGKTQVPASGFGLFVLTKTGAATVSIRGL